LTSHPIGVFDSGLGGLTVLRALLDRLPREDFLYFADTQFLPYGDRTEAFLRERGVLIARSMARRGVKALVVACNTATAAAAEAIRDAVDLPVVAIEPAVKPAAALTKSSAIAVMATTRTVESPRFRRLVENHAGHVRVHAQACPGLAEAIERHGPDSGGVAALLDRFVAPLGDLGIDVLALGCTHYPWVRAAIAARLPAGVTVLDTGDAVARQLERLLAAANRQGGGEGRVTVATSGAAHLVAATVDRLWGQNSTHPLMVEHWEPRDE
jgi:glutamate racemase